MKTLIKNGTVVNAKETEKKDILIEDDKIIRIAPQITDEAEKIIDAEGKYVFPGFIDAHTHFDLDFPIGATADDFESGTIAALAGGTTTVIDFATQDKGGTLNDALINWNKKAGGKSSCNYGFHMAITDWNESIPEQMHEMCEKGIPSFKVYLAYDNIRISEEQIYNCLKTSKELGGLVVAHCENGDMVNRMVAAEKKAGHMTPDAHPVSRPDWVEAEAVADFLDLAAKADAPAYVVHISTEAGMNEVRHARNRGQKVYGETCPHYLALTEEKYHLPDFESAKFVCSPPLRTKANVNALWDAASNGEMDVIATDHCSFTFEGQKILGKDDFSKIPNGLPGVENRAQLIYTLGVCENKISLMQMCELLSEKPAKIFGMYPHKGCIKEGADADVVIFDPNTCEKVSYKNLHHNVDYSPYEGMEMKGSSETVILNGKVCIEKGNIIARNEGKYVHRESRQK